MSDNQDRSCWTCLCHFDEPDNPILFGTCNYFLQVGKKSKEIPVHIADVGCKHWEARIKQMEMDL